MRGQSPVNCPDSDVKEWGQNINLCLGTNDRSALFHFLDVVNECKGNNKILIYNDLSDLTNYDAWKISVERQEKLRNKLYDRVVENLSQQYNIPLLHATSIEKKKYRIYGDYPVILNLNTEIKKDSMNNLQSLLKAD